MVESLRALFHKWDHLSVASLERPPDAGQPGNWEPFHITMRVAVILDEGLILMEAALLHVGRCLETKSFLGCRRMTWVPAVGQPAGHIEGSTCSGGVGGLPGKHCVGDQVPVGLSLRGARAGARSTWSLSRRRAPSGRHPAHTAFAFQDAAFRRAWGQLSAVLGRWVLETWVWNSCFRGKSSSKAVTQPPGFGGRRPAPPQRKRAVPQCLSVIRNWRQGSRVWKVATERLKGKSRVRTRGNWAGNHSVWRGGVRGCTVEERQQQKGALGWWEFSSEERNLGNLSTLEPEAMEVESPSLVHFLVSVLNKKAKLNFH